MAEQDLAIDRLIDELDHAFGGGEFTDHEQPNADIAAAAFPLSRGAAEAREELEIDGQPLIFDDEYNPAPDVSTEWEPERGFWQVDEKSVAEPSPGRKSRIAFRYYVGGAASFLLVAAGAAYFALQSPRDPVPALESDTSRATTGAVIGEEAAAGNQPPIAIAAVQPVASAPAPDDVNMGEFNAVDRFTAPPELAVVPDDPMAGERRVEAHEPLPRAVIAENLGEEGAANAPRAAPAEDATGGAVVLVQTTTIPVQTTTIPMTTPATTTAWVNLRSGPDNGADIIKVIEAGDAIEVVECDRWCNVIADGTNGWIHRDFVNGDMLPERAPPAAGMQDIVPFTTTSAARLSVYDSPFEDGRVSASFRAGVDILIMGCDLNWCEVRYGPDDQRGWVDRRQVRMPEDITEGQVPPLPPITRDEAAALRGA